MPADLLVAARIGLPHEGAGIVALDRDETFVGEYDGYRGRWRTEIRYVVHVVETPEPGERLPAIVEMIARLVTPPADRVSLLVDVTASGRPPVDLLTARRLRPVPVVVNQSDAARRGRGLIQVPAKDLVTGLTVLIAERRIHAPPQVENAEALAKQLQEFRAQPRKQRNPLQPVLDEPAGELVMALALAAWWGETRLSSLVRQPPPPRQKIPPPRPPTFDEVLQMSRRRRLERRTARI